MIGIICLWKVRGVSSSKNRYIVFENRRQLASVTAPSSIYQHLEVANAAERRDDLQDKVRHGFPVRWGELPEGSPQMIDLTFLQLRRAMIGGPFDGSVSVGAGGAYDVPQSEVVTYFFDPEKPGEVIRDKNGLIYEAKYRWDGRPPIEYESKMVFRFEYQGSRKFEGGEEEFNRIFGVRHDPA